MKQHVKDFYHKFSFAHTDMKTQCQTVVKESLKFVRNADVFIDIGCAEGGYVSAAANFYSASIGVDFCLKSLQKARKKKNCYYICADAEHLPLKKNCADFILCRGMLHHLKNEKKSVIEAKNTLLSGGAYSVSVYSKTGYYRYLYRIFHSAYPFLQSSKIMLKIMFLIFSVYFQAGCIITGRRTASFKHLRARYMDHFFAPVQLFFSEKQLEKILRYSGLTRIAQKKENFGMMHTLVMSKN